MKIDNIESFLKNVEAARNTKLLVLISWQNPHSKPSVECSSFEAFEALAKAELAGLNAIVPVLGVYSGTSEESAMIIFDKVADHIEAFSIVDSAIELGKKLGQQSVMTSSVVSNALWNCATGHAEYVGKGFKVNEQTDTQNYSKINDMKFSLNINFI